MLAKSRKFSYKFTSNRPLQWLLENNFIANQGNPSGKFTNFHVFNMTLNRPRKKIFRLKLGLLSKKIGEYLNSEKNNKNNSRYLI